MKSVFSVGALFKNYRRKKFTMKKINNKPQVNFRKGSIFTYLIDPRKKLFRMCVPTASSAVICGIDSLESIPRPLKRFQIRAMCYWPGVPGCHQTCGLLEPSSPSSCNTFMSITFFRPATKYLYSNMEDHDLFVGNWFHPLSPHHTHSPVS